MTLFLSPLFPLLIAIIFASTSTDATAASAVNSRESAMLAADEEAIVSAGLDRMYRMDYPAAEETFLKGLHAQSPARPYFAGIACLNRFLDWGDTAALRRAEAHWEALSPRGDPPRHLRGTDPDRLRLYRGLAGMQLSYTASLRGQRVRPATLALAAERQLRPLEAEAPEARAAMMLFDYYRGRLLERLPFFGTADFDVPGFTAAANESPPLREMFLSSLFWIHFDQKRFDAAQAVTRNFLETYPDNRLAREMRADGLYHAGRFAGARTEQEKLREEYALLAKTPGRLPLGYFRAVGNLARIHDALGQRREAEARLAEWRQAGRTGAAPWLPPSLKRDLAAL
jgi:tetratricopeptide (TPR) repeat protein